MIPSRSPTSETLSRPLDLTQPDGKTRWLETAFVLLAWSCALLSAGTLFWIARVVYQDARPAIAEFGLEFLWGREWSSTREVFGALPFVYGTLVTSAIALLLAVPFGLAVAIVTSETILPQWVRSPVAFLIELIAAIPSVIIGLWGIFVLVPFLMPLQRWLHATLGWIPLFGSEPFGPGLLAAGVLLAIMILPTIAAISRDVLLAIPPELRSASRSLGATRWETIVRTLLPAGSAGIIGAIVLALGRALGETMAVTMVIGNAVRISPSLLDSGYTIPAILANQFAEALKPIHIGALMYLALILFGLTLVVNVIAVVLVQWVSRRAIVR
ncbi:phosphate ABC transporter permease [Leptolyngbya valderiana BDU 20041]|nr:phosphate ABC transporter permease [Leptolyngbya valderiana BDU 20041]PPT08825.1 Phosphate transport system permease protein PstC [Geitlerinema sp. FC II]